jgi:hypothetical protein
VCTSLLVDVGNEVLLATASLIWNSLGGALGEELDGGVGGDALLFRSLLRVRSFGVDFGD